MYSKLSIEELRSMCRVHIENFEKWARTFIHQIFSKELGKDFLHKKYPDGNYIIRKKIVEEVDRNMQAEPSRFDSPMDAMFLEDLIYILCRDDFYKSYFSVYFKKMYPEGACELRTFLERLIPIRNKLSHANSISTRETEQCVCYCNDFIDCVKEYYNMTNQNKEFNIPTIIRVDDSLGNVYHIKEGSAREDLKILNPKTKEKETFYLGDKFSLYLTLDPSFEEDSYRLEWSKKDGVEIVNNGKQINVTITNKLIGESVILSCQLITKNDWHRRFDYDQKLFVHFKALPIKYNTKA